MILSLKMSVAEVDIGTLCVPRLLPWPCPCTCTVTWTRESAEAPLNLLLEFPSSSPGTGEFPFTWENNHSVTVSNGPINHQKALRALLRTHGALSCLIRTISWFPLKWTKKVNYGIESKAIIPEMTFSHHLHHNHTDGLLYIRAGCKNSLQELSKRDAKFHRTMQIFTQVQLTVKLTRKFLTGSVEETFTHTSPCSN